MKIKELGLAESMSFAAGHKDKEKGYWTSDTDPGNIYGDEFYKNSDKYMHSDEEPPANPDYDEDLDLNLSNHNMRQVFDEPGYGNPDDSISIDEFIGKTTQWLKQHIGKRSKEEPTTVDKSGGGATMISGGLPEGYFNRVIMRMNSIARTGKERGATHVWAV